MTRAEHMRWTKQRALDELAGRDGVANALASLCSDLGKHEDAKNLALFAFAAGMLQDSPEKMRKFIEGFAE